MVITVTVGTYYIMLNVDSYTLMSNYYRLNTLLTHKNIIIIKLVRLVYQTLAQKIAVKK